MDERVFDGLSLLGFLSRNKHYFGERLTLLGGMGDNDNLKVQAILSTEEEEIILEQGSEKEKDFIIIRSQPRQDGWFFHQAASIDQVDHEIRKYRDLIIESLVGNDV